ncbi:hypothetical protein ACLMAJ_16980 [Nocardia sp. KC 131]|uniref:hypothetical protein n=1 Tax=Nocardia arseniciresistens TaxID=3392119 RepID=UPI00398F3BD9
MSNKDDEEVSRSELAAFDILLDALNKKGVDSINAFDLVGGADWTRNIYRWDDRVRRGNRIRSILPDSLAKRDLGELTVKELLGIEIPVEELIELRRDLSGGKYREGS